MSENREALIEIVKSWVTLDNQIRALANKLKDLRKEKKTKNTRTEPVVEKSRGLVEKTSLLPCPPF